MKRANIIVLAIVIVGVGAIIWFQGFQGRQLPVLAAPEPQNTTTETKSASTTETAEANSVAVKPSDANAPAATTETATSDTSSQGETAAAQSGDKTSSEDKTKADVGTKEETPTPQSEQQAKTTASEETGDPNNPMEALNLKDVEMKNLVQKIGEWTGKVIIPVDDAMKQKITVFAPDKLPRKEALSLIYSALRTKGYVAEETDRIIYLKPIDKAKLGQVPTIAADQPLAAIENKEQIVQRFIKLHYSDAGRMQEIVKSFVGEYGEMRPDASTGTLLVIDTVANLMRIERIVQEFDVPESEETTSQVFTLQNADPLEIVQMLRILLGDTSITSNVSRNRYSSYGRSGGNSTGSATFMGPNKQQIVLIPVDKYKWVIARAAPQDLKTISEWIDRLDLEDKVKSEYETLPVVYGDAREIASRIEEAFAEMPGSELKPSVLVRPLEQSRQVMIFGRKDLREMVKNMIKEIDIPSGEFEKKTFKLKYADAEQIKANIDSLYGEDEEGTNRDSYYYYYYLSRRQTNPGDMVRVIAFSTMQQVTVICSPEKMRKIEKQIEDWDVPLEVDKVKPQIITLRNSDPVQMAELLTKLFSEEQDSTSFWDWYYGYSGDNKKKIIGPLYGQLTFEEVPGTKKIIVISKIPEAYKVIRDLIEDLDRQEMAETPKVITIKYADPEDLAERLNALFNERGTPAAFRLSEKGLSSYQMNDDQNNNNNNNNNNRNNNSNNNNNNNQNGQYQTWWSSGRDPVDQEPLSNVIGRVRFIPDSHSKSLLVLSPPEFYDSIEAMVRELDVPGKQVLVKAVIVEVDHSNMTSLGVQLATDPTAFGDLSENSLTALGNLTHLATHGTATLNSNSAVGASGSGTILGATVDIYALLDFLEKKVHARILNQQSLWTKDNAEANFFKGDNVAFNTNSSVTGTGIVTGAIQRTRVGMSLRVRPSITPEQRVDMIVNVILSQLTGDLINTQPVASEVETTTNMIVKDGQTIMLGGILFQRDSQIEHKLPLLGDLPLLGGLFRHNMAITANSELIVFITPYVMSDDGELAQSTPAVMEESLKKLDTVRSQLHQATADLAGPDPNQAL